MKKNKVIWLSLGFIGAIIALITFIKRLLKPELDPNQGLRMEFDLAQAVAVKSVEDRMTLLQLYVVFVGALLSYVTTKIPEGISEPTSFSYLVIGVCAIIYVTSWLFFLMIIRLRKSWLEAMEEICELKEQFIVKFPDLAKAIRWRKTTLQPGDRVGTTSYYIAIFITCIQNMALVVGVLVTLRSYLSITISIVGGLTLVLVQLILYKRLLKD